MIEKKDEIIIYNTEDGKTNVKLYTQDGMIWMNQQQIALLFESSKQNISLHSDKATQTFFATTQNKLIYAVTHKTAADLILSRADSSKPNMALTSWKGSIVRKQDIYISKNYLTKDELDILNRMVIIFLETAELRAKKRKYLTMLYWKENFDKILVDNGFSLLNDKGGVLINKWKRKLRLYILNLMQSARLFMLLKQINRIILNWRHWKIWKKIKSKEITLLRSTL